MTDSKVHKEGVDFVTTLRLTAQVHSPITARLFERAADEIERLSSTLSNSLSTQAEVRAFLDQASTDAGHQRMVMEVLMWRREFHAQTEYSEAFRAALASIAYQMSDDGFNSESAAVVRATAQGIAERALIKNQRQGADSPASQVSDPSTGASSAHGVTTPADSAPSDVRSEVAQSAPATNEALTVALKDVLRNLREPEHDFDRDYDFVITRHIKSRIEGALTRAGIECELLEQECADTDRLLVHLGIRIEQGRSEGGRLLVSKIASILEKRGVKIERGRPVPPHTTGPAVYTGNDRG